MASGATRGRGRFLPGDPRTAEPYRLTPQLALRVAILAFLALAVFAVLFLRLWALQVLSGDRYLAQANDNRVRTIRARGAARAGARPLRARCSSRTSPGTRVELWPADLPKTLGRRAHGAARARAWSPACRVQGDARAAEASTAATR